MAQDIKKILLGCSSQTNQAFLQAALELPANEPIKKVLEKILQAASLDHPDSEKLLAATVAAMYFRDSNNLPEHFRVAVQPKERLENHLMNNTMSTNFITGPLCMKALSIILAHSRSNGPQNTPG